MVVIFSRLNEANVLTKHLVKLLEVDTKNDKGGEMKYVSLSDDDYPVLNAAGATRFMSDDHPIDENFKKVTSMSASELQDEVDKSNIRYLVMHCTSSECETMHCDSCSLSGIKVTKTLEEGRVVEDIKAGSESDSEGAKHDIVSL